MKSNYPASLRGAFCAFAPSLRSECFAKQSPSMTEIASQSALAMTAWLSGCVYHALSAFNGLGLMKFKLFG